MSAPVPCVEEPGATGDDLPRRLMDAARRDSLTWADRHAIGQAIGRLQSATKEIYDLNWALGTPGYEQMHDPVDQAASEAAHAETLQRIEAMRKHKARVDTVMALIDSPEIENFLRGTHLEAVHQVDRWGAAHDRAKRPADWFWLVGYLAGKALHAATSGDQIKARHHCISTAAALYNWHSAIQGLDVRMCPGRSDVAEIVDAAFPGEGGAA